MSHDDDLKVTSKPWAEVTPADVSTLHAPTKAFLCPLAANTFGVDFIAFKIRNMDNQATIFEVSKDPNAPPQEFPPDFDLDALRSIQYTFPASFLTTKTVGTSLLFRVGNNEVKNFRMIERHYFRGKLIKSYDFTFPFCIPNSQNEWEAIYDLPQLPIEQVRDMIESPFQTQSDSFYFVGDRLIMHNKASYEYVE